jgi:hypothetical protein
MNNNTASDVQSTKFLPWWMWVIVGIEAGIPIFFALSTISDPGSLFPGAKELDYAMTLYITRNITMGVGVLISAVILRSHTALFATIAARFLTDGVDQVSTITSGASDAVMQSLPYLFVILIVIPLIGLVWLWKHKKEK